MHYHDFIDWGKAALAASLAFMLHLTQAHADSAYLLLLCLYTFDFACGLGLALARLEFDARKFKKGAVKLLGYVLLMIPLLLADHFLEKNPNAGFYLYLKNWLLLYMSTVEGVSIGAHLRRLGLPIPSLEDLRCFRASLGDLPRPPGPDK